MEEGRWEKKTKRERRRETEKLIQEHDFHFVHLPSFNKREGEVRTDKVRIEIKTHGCYCFAAVTLQGKTGNAVASLKSTYILKDTSIFSASSALKLHFQGFCNIIIAH